jgi:subtilisin family serine protease
MGVMVGGSAGGTAIGVAPGATWIAAKIFNDRGTTTTTAIHQAYQWLLDPDHNPATADAPNVVNDSWTMASAACNLEFQPDLRAVRSAGIAPVFAAGNAGPISGSVLSPANLPEALAVGSVDGADVVDPASGRGPSSCTQGIDPGVTAPGVSIRTTDLYRGYVQVSGTSLAAPHAAGVFALLLSGGAGDVARPVGRGARERRGRPRNTGPGRRLRLRPSRRGRLPVAAHEPRLLADRVGVGGVHDPRWQHHLQRGRRTRQRLRR